MSTWRNIARSTALLVAAGLVAYGIVQPIERDGQWLICVWAAGLLLGVVAWLSLPAAPRSLSRNLRHVGVVVGGLVVDGVVVVLGALVVVVVVGPLNETRKAVAPPPIIIRWASSPVAISSR